MKFPDWHYDDRRQVGLDFDDEGQVAAYDERQSASADRERALLEKLGVRSGFIIADIGCGTGLLACEAAKLGAFVHAIDISKPMLRAAERRAAAQGLKNIAFHNAGFLSFERDEGSLDLLISQFALHHLPDFWKAVALTRMRRVLKPGGKLYLRDVVFTCESDHISEAVERWIEWMGKNTGYSRGDVAQHVREEHTTFAWVMEGMIARAGFRLASAEYENEVYGAYIAEAIAKTSRTSSRDR
jgi:ubiquinone/menaquinone biosynthesis C-methylase UbiE